MRAVAALGLSLVVLTAQGDPTAAGRIVTDIEQQLAAARVPGAAIAVVSGTDVYAGGYGLADAASGTAMTPQTLMQVGSLTKVFTALAIASTLEMREMPMQTAVGSVKPLLSSRAAAATFHQLLTHTSGLRDRESGVGEIDELALASSARELTDTDFVLPPNVVFSYSNPGYALAGAALEHLSKKGFAEALREAALAPLGMERSTIRPSEVMTRPHAAGHRLEAQTPVPLPGFANDTTLWPAGYLWSNANDMSRALLALLNLGRVAGSPGVSSAVVRDIMTPHVEMPNVLDGGQYGYGLMIARDRRVLMLEHGGTVTGYSSILRIAPERRLGVALLTNLDNAPLRRITQEVMARALNLPAAASESRQETDVTASEMTPFLGRYQNRGTAELAVLDGHVVLNLDERSPMVVSRIGAGRYLARPGPGESGPEFVLRPATTETPAYLHLALWAYVRR